MPELPSAPSRPATFQRTSNAKVKGSMDVKNAGGPTSIIGLTLTTIP